MSGTDGAPILRLPGPENEAWPTGEAAVAGVDSPQLSNALEPLRLRNAGEQIAERLVAAIALGEYVVGQRLPPERELARLLGVSRPSVREALHRLAGSGYVEIRRGRQGGAYVKASWGPRSADMIRRTLLPNWRHFEHLFDLRRLLESLIARTAAQRHGPEDVGPIRDALQSYIEAGSDREASRAADTAIHTAIARATHNPYLAGLSAQIRAQVTLGFLAEPYSPAIRARAIEQHRELVRAVLRRRPAAAAAAASTHFTLTEGAMRALRDRVLGSGAGAGEA